MRSRGFYGHGCFEASFKPIAAAGVVTSFFTFAGPYDNGGNGKHNEIDIEFLGYDTSRVQLNFWTNDDSYASRNEALVDLGFDAAGAFHSYGFKWTSTGIAWYVDGSLVHEVYDRPDNPVPQAGESLHKIMVNAWPVDETAALWARQFSYPGQLLHGRRGLRDHGRTGTPTATPADRECDVHVRAGDRNESRSAGHAGDCARHCRRRPGSTGAGRGRDRCVVGSHHRRGHGPHHGLGWRGPLLLEPLADAGYRRFLRVRDHPQRARL